jgi:hypothetical protein
MIQFRDLYWGCWVVLYVGFAVLAAVVMKSTVFWDIMPCSPLKVSRRFGGICRLYVQGQRKSWARNLLSRWFFVWLFLWLWRWRRRILPKRRLTYNGLHGIISQTIIPFKLFFYYITYCAPSHSFSTLICFSATRVQIVKGGVTWTSLIVFACAAASRAVQDGKAGRSRDSHARCPPAAISRARCLFCTARLGSE